MRKILFLIGMFLSVSLYASGMPSEIYKGNASVWGAVLVSSYATHQSIVQFNYSTMSYSNPIISSVTYSGLIDWEITVDDGGSTVWFSNTPGNINTNVLSATNGCVKKVAGKTFSPDGRLYDAIG